MTIATAPTSTPNLVPTPVQSLPETWTRHRWTGEEFDRLVEQGFLREGSSTFLWDGEIIEPMSEDNPQFNTVYHLRRMFESRFQEDAWSINTDFPVDLIAGYRPQPDIMLLRGPRSNYRVRRRRPKQADVALLVEVSDTSYAADGGELLRHYALAGVPQYWIVHIQARRIEVYTDPDPESQAFRSRRDYGLDDLVPLVVNGVAEFEPIAVRDVLQDSLDEG